MGRLYSGRLHEAEAAPDHRHIPAVLHLGGMADHHRPLLVREPPLVRDELRSDLLDHGHRRVVHAGADGRGRGQVGERAETLRRVAPGRRRDAGLAADREQPGADVLDDDADDGLLHADPVAGDHRRLQRAEAGRPRRDPRLPADPGLGHDRLHRRDVDHEPPRTGNLAWAVLHRRRRRAGPGPVRLHPAAGAAADGPGAQPLAHRRPRPVLVPAAARPQHGGVFLLRHAAGRGAAADQCLWRHVPWRIRQRSGVRGHAGGALPGDHHVDLADFRNAVHPHHPVLPEALRDQDGDDTEHAGVVPALRPVRLRRPRRRPVDDRAVVHRLRHGLRLLQHLRLAVRRAAERPPDPRQRPGLVHADDQRHRRDPRQRGQRLDDRPLVHRRRRQQGLARYLG